MLWLHYSYTQLFSRTIVHFMMIENIKIIFYRIIDIYLSDSKVFLFLVINSKIIRIFILVLKTLKGRLF